MCLHFHHPLEQVVPLSCFLLEHAIECHVFVQNSRDTNRDARVFAAHSNMGSLTNRYKQVP